MDNLTFLRNPLFPVGEHTVSALGLIAFAALFVVGRSGVLKVENAGPLLSAAGADRG